MSQRTSRGYLASLTKRLAICARNRDVDRLNALLRSEEFVTGFVALNSNQRMSVIGHLAHAYTRCEARKDREKPLLAPTRRHTARWKDNDALISKLRKMAARYQDNAELGRVLGISKGAAKLARYRYARPSSENRLGASLVSGSSGCTLPHP